MEELNWVKTQILPLPVPHNVLWTVVAVAVSSNTSKLVITIFTWFPVIPWKYLRSRADVIRSLKQGIHKRTNLIQNIKKMLLKSLHIYCPAAKLWEAYIFSRVCLSLCLSVCPQMWSMWPPPMMHWTSSYRVPQPCSQIWDLTVHRAPRTQLWFPWTCSTCSNLFIMKHVRLTEMLLT